jgi:hypothetical protein
VATLRSLTIENFKAIKDPVKIEFKPITLLFGPNSAGKSTIIQALLYLREIFVNRNFNPSSSLVRGELVDLGGFRAMVHDHNLSLPIKFTVEIDFDAAELPDYIRNNEIMIYVKGFAQEYLDCLQMAHRASVSVSVCWNGISGTPYIDLYRVDLNDEFFCEINAGNILVHLWRYQMRVNPIQESEDFYKKLEKGLKGVTTWVKFHHSLFKSNEGDKKRDLLWELAKSVRMDPVRWGIFDDYEERKTTGLCLEDDASALPNLDNAFKQWGNLIDIEYRKIGIKKLQKFLRLSQAFNEILNRSVAGPGKLIRDILQNICYLGPLRTIPPRFFEKSRSVQKSAFSPVTTIWDELFDLPDETIGSINEWLAKPELLNTEYAINFIRYKEFDSNHLTNFKEKTIAEQDRIISELGGQPERTRLTLRKANSKLELDFRDVGTGISQVIPVVISALVSHDQIVTIEQPEIHIHPALQVSLADLFISRIRDEKAPIFLLETHSEHLILRMLRRIRETSENKLPRGAPSLRPDQVNVIYIQLENGTIRVLPLRIDETGEFIDRWPRGFFEERAEELF